MHNFSYYCPSTLSQALKLLGEAGPTAKPLAGGTDLVLRIRHRQLRPPALVSLRRLVELGAWGRVGEGWRFGALTRLTTLAGPEVGAAVPLLQAVARQMASPEIRQVATLGGNLCNADPAADLLPPLLALGARVGLTSAAGARRLGVADFYQGAQHPALAPGELLTAVEVPEAAGQRPWGYASFATRPTMGITLVSAVCLFGEESHGARPARLVLGALTERPLVLDLELPRDLGEAAALVEEEVGRLVAGAEVRESPQVPSWYLRRRAGLVAREALAQAWERMGRGGQG